MVSRRKHHECLPLAITITQANTYGWLEIPRLISSTSNAHPFSVQRGDIHLVPRVLASRVEGPPLAYRSFMYASLVPRVGPRRLPCTIAIPTSFPQATLQSLPLPFNFITSCEFIPRLSRASCGLSAALT